MVVVLVLKSWDWVRHPPTPPSGQNPNFGRKLVLKVPLEGEEKDRTITQPPMSPVPVSHVPPWSTHMVDMDNNNEDNTKEDNENEDSASPKMFLQKLHQYNEEFAQFTLSSWI